MSRASASDVEENARLNGHWVNLEPLSADNAIEAAQLNRPREMTPQMGGAQERIDVPGPFGPPLAVRLAASGEVVGLMESGEMVGYPGVAVVVIFIDPERAPAGAGVEAYTMFIDYVFAWGARIVHLEVLSFNREVLSLLRKAKQTPQARLRDHVYVAGRHWDLVIFGFTHAEWMVQVAPWRRILPGGDRRPAALGRKQKGGPP
jgi:RimJ/RimL family protein N-acetyltransferase